MVRPLRIEYPGALYHVMSRGNERQAIVRDNYDYHKRLDWLKRTVETYGWQLYAFVIMKNHDHLFIKTPEANLSAGMHFFNSGYTSYFNHRHQRVGHLFQGRYRGQVIEEEGYYLEVSRYIHLNPVRAGLVKHPEEYPFSSYPGYRWSRRELPWITYSVVFDEFGSDPISARRSYFKFIQAGMNEDTLSPFADALGGLIIGSSGFFERIRKMLGDCPADRERPAIKDIRKRPPLEIIITSVAERFGQNTSNWKPGTRSDDTARAVAAYLARRKFGYPATAVAQALGYTHPSSISRAINRVESSIGDMDKTLWELEKNTNH